MTALVKSARRGRLRRGQTVGHPPTYVVASGLDGSNTYQAGKVYVKWLTPDTGHPASYTITNVQTAQTLTAAGTVNVLEVTSLMTADNTYYTFTVTANAQASTPSNPVMVGPDVGADHTGQGLRVTWAKYSASSVGYAPTGQTLTVWNPASITGLTGTVTGSALDSLTFTQAVTLTGLDITGSFHFTVPGVVFNKCRIRTINITADISGSGAGRVWNSATFNDCEIIGDTSHSSQGPTTCFSAGPMTVRRCYIHGFGDVFRPSNTGPGDTGWVVTDNYATDMWDGLADNGVTQVDTPHSDIVQIFGKSTEDSGTAGQDNQWLRNTFICHYPDSYNPGNNGLLKRTNAASAAGLNSVSFFGTMQGNVKCGNIWDSNIMEGGGFTFNNIEGGTGRWEFYATYRRNRVGLNSSQGYSRQDPNPTTTNSTPSGSVRRTLTGSCTASAGATTVTVTGAAFTTNDIGNGASNGIIIKGAGPGGADKYFTIASGTAGTDTVTLRYGLDTSVTAADVIVGVTPSGYHRYNNQSEYPTSFYTGSTPASTTCGKVTYDTSNVWDVSGTPSVTDATNVPGGVPVTHDTQVQVRLS